MVHFGFSYVGLAFIAMLLIPNFIWAKNKPGDHILYEQKPVECGRIVRDFIDGLDQ